MNDSDKQFAAAFERCEVPNAGFHHRDHIRLAWIYVKRYGADAGTMRIAAAIRKFAAHHGQTGKYHETVTIAWMRLVANAEHAAPAAGFEDFVARFPQILEKSALGEFYSDTLLSSEAARSTFLEPDLKPFPQ